MRRGLLRAWLDRRSARWRCAACRARLHRRAVCTECGQRVVERTRDEVDLRRF